MKYLYITLLEARMAKLTSVTEYPDSTKYLLVIFKTTSIYIPGDERSRTNPGHGYPGGTETYKTPEIYAYQDPTELSAHLQKLFQEEPKRTDLLVLEVGEKLTILHTISLE